MPHLPVACLSQQQIAYPNRFLKVALVIVLSQYTVQCLSWSVALGRCPCQENQFSWSSSLDLEAFLILFVPVASVPALLSMFAQIPCMI